MTILVVSGAYGRDYKSAAKALVDWYEGRDFIIRTFGPDDGRYVNRDDAGSASINIRYDADRKICIVPNKKT